MMQDTRYRIQDRKLDRAEGKERRVKTRCWILDAKCWMQDTRCKIENCIEHGAKSIE
jgi:hypothetical protein